MSATVISPKKLIEVALPLDAINVAAAREKSIRHGHPSTLHLWWARRPLAAARAVIFAQLVHDPEDLWRCQNPGVEPKPQHKGAWTKRRAELFELIEAMVKWENTTNELVLEPAREEIRRAWRQTCELNRDHPEASTLFDPNKMPGLHDPFAGGGTIPLEAQRLGLEAHASDLNPVAVLINKAMIEIPPKFAGRPPVHPDVPKLERDGEWKGAAGLAEDVRRYGKWMRDEAFRRIGHLYPPVEVTAAMAQDRPDLAPYVGQKLTVIAWLWARTVKSPNPAFAHIDVPLASTFILSSKPGKEAYVHPVIGPDGYTFTVRVGKPPAEAKGGTKSSRGANFRCLMSGVTIEPTYIKAEAVAGRMGQRLMAIVGEGVRGRIYFSSSGEHQAMAEQADPKDAAVMIHVPLANDPRNLWCLQYGLTHFDQLFTPRQLVALTTFSDLVGEVRKRIRLDAVAAKLPNDDVGLEAAGTGSSAYAEGISVYLTMALSKATVNLVTQVRWRAGEGKSAPAFSRQALPMVWDFADLNPFAGAGGDFEGIVDGNSKAIKNFPINPSGGSAVQKDAQQLAVTKPYFVSTDPPYYDNIGYADLSDFFHVWLRRTLRGTFPFILSTISTPKSEELVATPYRHGTKAQAEKFFLEGMTRTFANLCIQSHLAAPLTIYYAFKQSETSEDIGTSSAGWQTFLAAVASSGLAITGTWPMRTENFTRMNGMDTNALASSVILVCRPRAKDAGTTSRRQFVRQLNEALPLALDAMTRASEGKPSPVAPVDLSQAIIGPGMAIFSRYDAVLEADGTPMSVRTALQLINRFLAEDDFDGDTQFCLHWFEQHGWEAGKFGEADTLARAKGTSVEGVRLAGVILAAGGVVRLLRWREYAPGWDPRTDTRLPVWEALHQLIRAYNTDGDTGAAHVLAAVAGKAEAARQLAYRLYTLCERAGRAEDARAYNEVVTGWTGIEAATQTPGARQGTLFGDDA